MKVLHIQKVSAIGGSERHLLHLLPGLALRGLSVRMCVLAAGAFERFVDELEGRGVETIVVPASRRFGPLDLGRVAREVRRVRPDLVHTHLIHADVCGQVAARAARIPTICTLHSTTGFYRRLPYRAAAQLAGHLAHRTIAISQHVRRFAERLRLAPASRLRVVPYGIRADEWPLGESAREEARRGLGLSSQHVVVGVASRLVPHKGHDLLIEAAAKALREVSSMRLLVAGDGPLRRRLEDRAHALLPSGNFRFLGYVSDIRAFMGACDILVFPSLPAFGEGFGLAALEAMAAARPVVATAVDSLPEVVGDAGILVAPEGPDGLAGALVALATDPTSRAEIGARAHERARTWFTVDRMVERTIGVYAEVV